MPITILLIEDDPDDFLMFSEAIRQLGQPIDLYHFKDGIEALAHLSNPLSIIPKIVFLDISLPAMSGWECLRKIKKIAGFNDIPVIMYSSADLRTTNRKANFLLNYWQYNMELRLNRFDRFSKDSTTMIIYNFFTQCKPYSRSRIFMPAI